MPRGSRNQVEKETLFTEERFLPKIMVDLGVVKSTSEVRRNRKELFISLDYLDYKEVKWGKHRLYNLELKTSWLAWRI